MSKTRLTRAAVEGLLRQVRRLERKIEEAEDTGKDQIEAWRSQLAEINAKLTEASAEDPKPPKSTKKKSKRDPEGEDDDDETEEDETEEDDDSEDDDGDDPFGD